MAINIQKLFSGEVSKIAVDYSFSAGDNCEVDLSGIYGVSFTSDVKVTGEIVNMAGYIRLTGEVSVDYTTECARCLKPLDRTFKASFERSVVNAGGLVNASDEENDDYIEVENGQLMLEPTVAEIISLEIPSRELCSEDCKGLCPKCGKDLNTGDCGCPKKEIDPRLAILQKLLEK